MSGTNIDPEFFNFKVHMNSLRSACEHHFNRSMCEIKKGLPDIAQDTSTENIDIDFTFDGSGIGAWNCRLCKQSNEEKHTTCVHCRAPRPKLDFESTDTAK